MTLFPLLLIAFALLHLPGLRSWPGGPRPADKAAGALAIMLFVPGAMHFATPARFVAMIEPFLPGAEFLVHACGAAELLIALALLVPEARRFAGWAAVALFIAIWPANIAVALAGEYPAELSQSPVYHWIRVPFQLVFIGWAAWVARGHLPGRALRRRVMARFYDRVQAGHERWAAPIKRELFEGVGGSVLELGPGTGINFAYYPQDVEWIGIEPNVHMHAALTDRAAAHGITRTSIRTVTAEGMDVESASVDVVVSTLVLCSVADAAAVLADIRRVLRPGGRFLFLEHVGAPQGSRARRMQRWLRPCWQFCADGCCPDRDTADAIRAAGFAAVDIEELAAPRDAVPPFVSPHIAGEATVSR